MDPNQQAAQGQPKEDYLDKGLDAVEKKFGHGKIDPNSASGRSTNEKITDGARNAFTKITGKHVPEKFSN